MEQVGVLMQSFSEAKTKMHNAQCSLERGQALEGKISIREPQLIKGAVKM
jgi:hypothetical protein